MRLYQFILPVRSNDGRTSYEKARATWTAAAIDMAGGITECGGAWQGAYRMSSGDIVREEVAVYLIACSVADREELVRLAFKLFPDQEALYVSDVGSTDIISREELIL